MKGPKVIPTPLIDNFTKWIKSIFLIGGVQAIIQVISLLSGIFIIRSLSIQEYAYYTIANTVLGTMTVLADGGISTGVMSEGAKVWNDKDKLGVVLSIGLMLRKRFALASLCISLPILVFLLYNQHADITTIIIISISVIPAFYAALSDSILEIIPKLHQDIKSLQSNQFLVSILRFILTIGLIFFFPFTFIALLATGFPRVYGNHRLKKIAFSYANIQSEKSKDIENKILKIVKRLLPTNIYYCFSGQITLWIISIFGSTNLIAQIGALTRLSMILSFLNVIFNILITPRFSKLSSNKGLLLSSVLKIQIGYLIILTSIIIFTWLFPSQILQILGKEYGDLNNELILNVSASCLSLFAGVIFTLYTSRGWAINPLISIPSNIAAVIVGGYIFDISSILGVLYLNIFTAAIQIIMNEVFIIRKIFTLNNYMS